MTNEREAWGPQYEIAYELGLEQLKRDEASLDELRGRTGTLLSAATIGTAFLGAVSATPGGLGWLSVVGLGLFALVVVICVLILWPYRGWKLMPAAEEVIAKYIESKPRPTASVPEMRRGLAVEMGKGHVTNEDKLRWLYKGFEAAAILLLAEVAAWIMELLV